MLTAPVGSRAAVLAAFLLAATVWSASAVGQVLCGPRDGLDDLLKQRFGETQQAVGVSADARRIVELFVAPDGSWTIIVTDAHGRSCIVLSGEDWTQTPQMDGNASQSPREPYTGIFLGLGASTYHIGVLARLLATQAGVRSLSGPTPPRY